MKYIDADLLKSKLKDVATEFKTGNYYLDNSEQVVGYENALIDFEQLVDSLQQEQPEVDLEKELDKFYGMYRKDGKTYDITDDEEVSDWKEDGNSWFKIEFARHFYELGQIEMRHRITNPEYNAKVVEQLKSEYPARKED